MSLKIYKSYSAGVPFSHAENENELAKITTSKYCDAVTKLSTSAGYFARMIGEIREWEAWRYVGISTFNEFCEQKLRKTMDEVLEVLHGVELLGGDPTEEEAKQASRSKRAVELVEAGTHTQSEAAREVDLARQTVHKAVLSAQNRDSTKNADKAIPLPMIRMTEDQSRVAAVIVKRLGADYARELASHLNMLANQ